MSSSSGRFDRDTREECVLYGIDANAVDNAENKFNADTDSIASNDSGKDDIPLQEQINSRLYIVRETVSGQQIWKRSMRDESDAIAIHIATNNRASFRVGCHSFRSMLPPLHNGKPPNRSHRWLRLCSRGVLQSYLLSRTSGHDSRSYRLRFPEHVYCWFADCNDDQRANDDRWAFYHGLKLSVDCDPEYWLVYNLLDDMQGGGFVSFVATSFETIHKHSGLTWKDWFGSEFSVCTPSIASKSQLMSVFRDGDCSSDNDGGNDDVEAFHIIPLTIDIANITQRELFEGVSTNINRTSAEDIDNSANVLESPSIDLFTVVQSMMKNYISQRKKTATQLRLMFETASLGVLTDSYDTKVNQLCHKGELITVTQLYQILKTLWKSITMEETVMIFREAYDIMYPPTQWGKPAPDGIDFQCFIVAVERLNVLSGAVTDKI